MRDNIKNFVKLVANNFDLLEPIVEIGSYHVEGQEGYADIRPFFPGKMFIGCDMRRGPGVDRIEDIHRLTFENDSVGTVFILDTLEHVEDCHIALKEIFRVLCKRGMLVMTSVMDFPIHDYPYDYWRFTPRCFELLLKNFFPRKVFFQGNPLFPHTVIGLGVKNGNDPTIFTNLERLVKNFEDEALISLDLQFGPKTSNFRYPVNQLSCAYELLTAKDQEIQRLKNQLEEIIRDLEVLKSAYPYSLLRMVYRKLIKPLFAR